MKTLFPFFICLFAFLFAGQPVLATELNFGLTTYFTAPDSTSLPGTVLTSSGNTLSTFNFTGANPNHPIFKSGLYYPVTDCQNHNLWVKMRHVAFDPNGFANGQHITASTGAPNYGGNNMVGGWTGFLYQFEIYRDQNLTGTRTNVLGSLYPTTITVASLETLAYPQGPHEWICFQIQTPNSSGWNLNSINFTGSNPNSHPGFASRPYYVNPDVPSYYPPEFTEQFPTGKDSIYAIALPIGGYGEFKMTANRVARFQYGYEFNGGGYQGMSMAFGEGPVVADSLVNEKCYKTGGSIYLKPSGLGPYTFAWSNGQATQNLVNVPAGVYTATVTDGGGCSSQVTKTILPGPVFNVQLSQTLGSGNAVSRIHATVSGGVAPLSYLWNTGGTTDSLLAGSNGVYFVAVTDGSNCITRDTITVTGITGMGKDLESGLLRLIPNPAQDKLGLDYPFSLEITDLQILDALGKQKTVPFRKTEKGCLELDVRSLPSGMYSVQFQSTGGTRQLKWVKE